MQKSVLLYLISATAYSTCELFCVSHPVSNSENYILIKNVNNYI
uniref:Uncharacterized protein n=1 Tax=Anguilla anguilla TaxID=7936 RepID=A0A0E9QJV0_ANGAN